MATTTPTHIDSSIPEVWAKDVLRRVKVEGFWGRFVGKEGSGAPIIEKTELTGPGDLIHIQVTDPLTGAGQTGDTSTVEGNEENLASSEILVATTFYRHGVANYRRADKKSLLDLRREARMRLEEWARNKIDNTRFTMFLGTDATVLPSALSGETYTPNTYYAGTGNAAVDDLAVTDVLTVEELQKIKLKLRLQQAKPVMTRDGRPYYFFVTHPNATHELKQDTRYEAWAREARERGEQNPLFTGALLTIDGMVIFDHENVPLADNATSVQYAKSIAFGAEAFVQGLDEAIGAEEDTFDYKNKSGFEIHFAMGWRRALELSSTQVLVSAPDQV